MSSEMKTNKLNSDASTKNLDLNTRTTAEQSRHVTQSADYKDYKAL